MSIKVNHGDVAPEDTEYHTVWRHFRRDGPVGVGVGIVAVKAIPDRGDPDSQAEAHDVPEVHYVLSGAGVLRDEGVDTPLRAGDAVVTPAGHRHTMWSTSKDEPIVMVYVAMSPTAMGGGERR